MTESITPKLRDLLLNEFSEAEVVALCQDLGYSYDDLPGTGFFGKTRGLVETAQREGNLRALQVKLRELRPEAYTALGLGTTNIATELNGPGQTFAAPKLRPALGLIPLLLVAVIGAICLLALLPRLLNGSQPSALPTTIAAAPATSAPTSQPQAAAAQPTNAPTSQPTPTPSEAQGVVIVSTSSAPQVAQPTATSSIVVIAPQGSNPIVKAIQDINEKLPRFYRAELTEQDMQQDWRGTAYDGLVKFSKSALPRVLKLGNGPRTNIEATYEYLKPLTVANENGNEIKLTSREFWRYENKANNVVACETRDYFYTVVRESDRYVVTGFDGNLISSRCK
jgi:hypothetical protein